MRLVDDGEVAGDRDRLGRDVKGWSEGWRPVTWKALATLLWILPVMPRLTRVFNTRFGVTGT